jgi:hypothetical protein
MSPLNKIVVALFLLVYVDVATAGFKDGNALKRDLETTELFSYGYGFGYVIGVADAYDQVFFCLPSGQSGVTAGQLKDVVLRYLKEHPENLHFTAPSLIFEALKKFWPCPQQTNPAPPPRPSPKPKPKPKPEETSPF